jgi:hypothetical protein
LTPVFRQEIEIVLGEATSAEVVVTGALMVRAAVTSAVWLLPCSNVSVAEPAETPMQLAAADTTNVRLVVVADSVPLAGVTVTPVGAAA